MLVCTLDSYFTVFGFGVLAGCALCIAIRFAWKRINA
jgi:hypothetical protein